MFDNLTTWRGSSLLEVSDTVIDPTSGNPFVNYLVFEIFFMVILYFPLIQEEHLPVNL